jgi:hypothetical protein
VLEGEALDPNMIVKTNHLRQPTTDSSLSKQKPCPKCNKLIRLPEWQDHMKVCMMDTKQWLEQKQHREIRESMPSLATDNEIASNLKRFASQRPDLYTEVDAPEVDNVVKPTVIWDGRGSKLTRTDANIAMIKAQQKKNEMEALVASQKRQKRE